MGIFIDVVLAVPIGILYNTLIHTICDTFNSDLSYNEKMQKNLIIIFVGSIIGGLIAYYNEKNRALKYGLYLGSILLFSHAVLYNWAHMHNDTKIIVMAMCFILLIWFTYNNSKKKYTSSKDYNDLDDDKIYYLPATYTQKEHYKDTNDTNDISDDAEIINYKKQ